MAASSALRARLRARAAQKSHLFALQFPYFLSNLSYTGVGTMQLILGSSSASCRQILSEMGYKFTLLSADIDEKEIRKEKPEELVVTLAHAKADAILEKMKNNGMMKEIVDSQDTTLMITADQQPISTL